VEIIYVVEYWDACLQPVIIEAKHIKLTLLETDFKTPGGRDKESIR
jgi:hypothetical protein